MKQQNDALRKVLEQAIKVAVSPEATPDEMDKLSQRLGVAALAAEGLAALEQQEAYSRFNRLARNFDLQLEALPALLTAAHETLPAGDPGKAVLQFLTARTPLELAAAILALKKLRREEAPAV